MVEIKTMAEEQFWLVNHTKGERFYLASKIITKFDDIPKRLKWIKSEEIELVGNLGTHQFIGYSQPTEMSDSDWRSWCNSGVAQGVCVHLAKKFGVDPTALYQDYLQTYIHPKYTVKI